jgi:ABC-type ATPase with predicted acetyltransferase domain
MNLRNDLVHIAAVSAMIRDMLDADPDETAFLDTLEGETDALDLADILIAKMLDDAAIVEAIDVQMKALADRKSRIDRRHTTVKDVIGALLDAMGVKKLERPRATVSRRAGSLSVRITDEASIPSQLCRVKTTTAPDKAAIRAQLEAGETVPGAELARGEDGLSVRVA